MYFELQNPLDNVIVSMVTRRSNLNLEGEIASQSLAMTAFNVFRNPNLSNKKQQWQYAYAVLILSERRWQSLHEFYTRPTRSHPMFIFVSIPYSMKRTLSNSDYEKKSLSGKIYTF